MLSSEVQFPPMPDSILSLRSLAQKFLLTHRCGREELVGLRFKYHQTSDPVFARPNLLFSPRRLPTTIVPSTVADEAPFLVPEAFFLPTSYLLLFSPMLSNIRSLCSSAVAAPEILSRPMHKLADRRFIILPPQG